MEYIERIFILCIFISIFFQEISTQYKEMHFPLKLANIKILYTSKFEIDYERKIIVDYPNEILFWDRKQYKIKKLNYKGFEISTLNYYPNIEDINWNMKPQDYRLNREGINYYFSSYCNLYLFNYYAEPKWKYYSHEISFENLDENGINYCVLEIAFNDYRQDEIAVYNLNNNKIVVINLFNKIKNKQNNDLIEISMDDIIAQALIYSDEEGTKLIGIDISGKISFWGLHGLVYSYWLINTFKFNSQQNYYYQTAGIIGKNEKKLLYINNDNFILFDLKEIKIINQQPGLISKVSTILILDNGQALVGNGDGFIYLIELSDNKIFVLDKYEICKGKKVIIISYNTTCPRNHEICYIFAATCGFDGCFTIFQIQNEGINDL